MPTCLFTRRGDTRPEIQTLKTLALAEHARAVEDGRLQMVNIEKAPLRSTILPPSLNARSPSKTFNLAGLVGSYHFSGEWV